MKQGIHPKTQQTTATCGCGASFTFTSTAKEIKTEICSACHPFYTGKQKLVDTAGKVDKFRAKMEKAKTASASKKKKISESVKAAAAASARGSAVDAAKMVSKVKNASKKRELAKAKADEEKKAKKDEEAKAEKVEEKVEESAETETPPTEEAKKEE